MLANGVSLISNNQPLVSYRLVYNTFLDVHIHIFVSYIVPFDGMTKDRANPIEPHIDGLKNCNLKDAKIRLA